jgi:adenylosuccinate lyase
MPNENVLSVRYATPEINEIFSDEGRLLAERELWIAVMKGQRELGVNIPAEDIEKYEKAKHDIDAAWIEARERETRHDVKAKIEAFVKVSGAGEYIHKGMTSRDLTDNVEQMQIKKASNIIFGKNVSILRHMLDRANMYRGVELTARTHHQAAQPTTLGRRFSMWAEELMFHLEDFENFIDAYPLRGIKGPVGTQFDMVSLLGDPRKVNILEDHVARQLGFSKTLSSPGQVYPRSLDYSTISKLAGLTSACESFGKTMRLMAGYDLVTEGFKEGQVGSSAMPHKMNTRSSERVCGLAHLVKMYADGASRLAGDQWEEGDVSCSVIRRIVIPDSFYASDGLCETALTVLNEMGAYPVVINAEVDKYLPFMASTELITLATQKGVGREAAHKVIKKYAVQAALEMRQEGKPPSIADNLARDPVFQNAGIGKEQIESMLKDRAYFIGNARNQIAEVRKKANYFMDKYPGKAAYEPRDIL